MTGVCGGSQVSGHASAPVSQWGGGSTSSSQCPIPSKQASESFCCKEMGGAHQLASKASDCGAAEAGKGQRSHEAKENGSCNGQDQNARGSEDGDKGCGKSDKISGSDLDGLIKALEGMKELAKGGKLDKSELNKLISELLEGVMDGGGKGK